eukprot:UN25125
MLYESFSNNYVKIVHLYSYNDYLEGMLRSVSEDSRCLRFFISVNSSAVSDRAASRCCSNDSNFFLIALR